jgi:hypothetical protein
VHELGDFWCQPVEMSQLERIRERNLDREQELELRREEPVVLGGLLVVVAPNTRVVLTLGDR